MGMKLWGDLGTDMGEYTPTMGDIGLLATG